MRIRILVPIVGANFSFSAGDVTDASEPNADRLIGAGYAEPVAETDAIETADASEPSVEHAIAKTTTKPRSKTK